MTWRAVRWCWRALAVLIWWCRSSEDNPLHLIEAARPDVLIKGADYTEDQVVGAAEVKTWGGEVRLAQVVEGYSTTAAIARMRLKSAR